MRKENENKAVYTGPKRGRVGEAGAVKPKKNAHIECLCVDRSDKDVFKDVIIAGIGF